MGDVPSYFIELVCDGDRWQKVTMMLHLLPLGR